MSVVVEKLPSYYILLPQHKNFRSFAVMKLEFLGTLTGLLLTICTMTILLPG